MDFKEGFLEYVRTNVFSEFKLIEKDIQDLDEFISFNDNAPFKLESYVCFTNTYVILVQKLKKYIKNNKVVKFKRICLKYKEEKDILFLSYSWQRLKLFKFVYNVLLHNQVILDNSIREKYVRDVLFDYQDLYITEDFLKKENGDQFLLICMEILDTSICNPFMFIEMMDRDIKSYYYLCFLMYGFYFKQNIINFNLANCKDTLESLEFENYSMADLINKLKEIFELDLDYILMLNKNKCNLLMSKLATSKKLKQYYYGFDVFSYNLDNKEYLVVKVFKSLYLKKLIPESVSILFRYVNLWHILDSVQSSIFEDKYVSVVTNLDLNISNTYLIECSEDGYKCVKSNYICLELQKLLDIELNLKHINI